MSPAVEVIMTHTLIDRGFSIGVETGVFRSHVGLDPRGWRP